MSKDDEYASKGVAGAGLGLGIAGTALALLRNGNGLGGILGGDGSRGRDEVLGELQIMELQKQQFGQAIETEKRLGALEAKQAATETAQKKDAEISALREVITDLKSTVGIDRATRHMVTGQVYLAPHNMADPYQGGRNVLMAQHFNGLSGVPGEFRNPYRDPWY